MRNRLLAAVGTLAALLTLSQNAPAGPGDSEPLGPDPHVLIHCPATLSHSAKKVTVWGHSHHMDCEAAVTMSPNRSGFTLTSHIQYNMGDGSWDDKFVYSIATGTLSAGQTINWTTASIDLCDWTTYYGAASTSVN